MVNDNEISGEKSWVGNWDIKSLKWRIKELRENQNRCFKTWTNGISI